MKRRKQKRGSGPRKERQGSPYNTANPYEATLLTHHKSDDVEAAEARIRNGQARVRNAAAERS